MIQILLVGMYSTGVYSLWRNSMSSQNSIQFNPVPRDNWLFDKSQVQALSLPYWPHVLLFGEISTEVLQGGQFLLPAPTTEAQVIRFFFLVGDSRSHPALQYDPGQTPATRPLELLVPILCGH